MQARRANIIAEGLVAGVVAHIAIALVLILSDLVAGRWLFYTPTLAGRAARSRPARPSCWPTPAFI
jgi:hypothetical protein